MNWAGRWEEEFMEMVALSLTLKDGEMDSQGEEAMVLDVKAGKGVEGDQSDLPEPNKVYRGRSGQPWSLEPGHEVLWVPC